MFSEYMETQEPLDKVESNENESLDNDNLFENKKDDSKNDKISEEEKNLQNSKSRLNERYDVMSNAYPNWSFDKILSTDENQNKQTKLNISRWEWWKNFSINMSEIMKWNDGKDIINKYLTLDFSNFVENIDWDVVWLSQNKDKVKQIPNININWDISMLAALITTNTENWKWENVLDMWPLDINSINGKNEIINYIDKNIMKAPVDSVYWYANKQYVDNILQEIKMNQKDILGNKTIENNDITDYILNSVDKESLSVYKKNVFDMIVCLGIILRNSSHQEISQLTEDNQDEDNNKSLLTKIPSITSWENIIEYLLSNFDFLLDNKDDLKSQVLSKYENEIKMEEFNFLVP